MARDIFAVPATGAGIERQFSKSGKVANWTRARLNHSTITDSILYKDMLFRYGEAQIHQSQGDGNLSDDDDDDEGQDDDDSNMEIQQEMTYSQGLWDEFAG